MVRDYDYEIPFPSLLKIVPPASQIVSRGFQPPRAQKRPSFPWHHIEASGNETITLVLARGSYHQDKPEKPAAAAPKAAAAPVQAWKWMARPFSRGDFLKVTGYSWVTTGKGRMFLGVELSVSQLFHVNLGAAGTTQPSGTQSEQLHQASRCYAEGPPKGWT